jgi:hypothetical protein
VADDMEKAVQLMDFFSNAARSSVSRSGFTDKRKKKRKSQETGPAAQVRPMTEDEEWCRLIDPLRSGL